jgi:hypothetical protein
MTNQPEARPCACGHLTNRHNALVSGPCPALGCDCPEFREPGPEVGFAPEQYYRTHSERDVFVSLTALGDYRTALHAALRITGGPRTDAELLSYAVEAIRYAQTLPPEVRYGETVTVAEVASLGGPLIDHQAQCPIDHTPEAGPCPCCQGDPNTVCDACGTHQCWAGRFMCENAQSAGTRQRGADDADPDIHTLASRLDQPRAGQ